MTKDKHKNHLIVQISEDGQKLLQFLVRRLSLPQPLLHRLVRTGQIRVNGGRIKPFVHIHHNDLVRLPPFLLEMSQSATHENENADTHKTWQVKKEATALELPPQVYADDNIIIFNKPKGLPVHAGTGHTDSLAARLSTHFSHLTFKPTPAHRLDKDTSGILCVALSYKALRTLQNAFENRTVHKEYLAWVHGIWQNSEAQILSHHIAKKYVGCDEKMRIVHHNEDTHGSKTALCSVRCLAHNDNHSSLMHIRLITGRTHQIRIQLAAMGHPVLGDGKYGTPSHNISLCLHSLRISFPLSHDFAELNLAGKHFATLPLHMPWQDNLSVSTLPNIFPELTGI